MPRLTTEERIAKAVADAISAHPQLQPAPKPPFFSPKSWGMWASIGTLVLALIGIFGSVNGWFETKFDKEQRLKAAYDGVHMLDSGDMVLKGTIQKNYWALYGMIHSRDSALDVFKGDVMDSFYDHRQAINGKKNK